MTNRTVLRMIRPCERAEGLIEAAVRYTGKPVSVPTLQSLPALFPFTLTRPLAYVISNSPHDEVQMAP